jgi:hypothetical protein
VVGCGSSTITSKGKPLTEKHPKPRARQELAELIAHLALAETRAGLSTSIK